MSEAQKGYTRYTVEVAGKQVYADYSPEFTVGSGQAHIEFKSIIDGEPNATSETGYRSHFSSGLAVGVDVQTALQELANKIMNEEAGFAFKKGDKIRVKFVKKANMWCVSYLEKDKPAVKWFETKMQANEFANEMKYRAEEPKK